MLARRCTLLALGAASCLDQAFPPYGEVRFSIDTDLPVPRVVNRLRIDVYSGDGKTWYASREIARLAPTDWPVTFGVHDLTERGQTVLVRLRAFHGSATRDYHGERFLERPARDEPGAVATAAIPEGEGPRLLVGGVDRTPVTEPEPLATLDRLVRVRVGSGAGAARVVLRGACAGTMADLARGLTCVDTENERASADFQPSSDVALSTASAQGTFGAERTCESPLRERTERNGAPLYDEEVCVPGGVYLFGNVESSIFGPVRGAVPVRIVLVAPFRMDRFEVTVGRLKAAYEDGFFEPVQPNEGGFDPLQGSSCTFSFTRSDRDAVAVNCIPFDTARAFCQRLGADLPTEAEFEIAYQAAGRVERTRFPWGNDDPTCDRAIFGRNVRGAQDDVACASKGGAIGPGRVDARESDDVAIGSGAVGLAGGMSEILRDSLHPFGSHCWRGAPLTDPWCDDPVSPNTVSRGGSWGLGADGLLPGVRVELPRNALSTTHGFRCVRPSD